MPPPPHLSLSPGISQWKYLCIPNKAHPEISSLSVSACPLHSIASPLISLYISSTRYYIVSHLSLSLYILYSILHRCPLSLCLHSLLRFRSNFAVWWSPFSLIIEMIFIAFFTLSISISVSLSLCWLCRHGNVSRSFWTFGICYSYYWFYLFYYMIRNKVCFGFIYWCPLLGNYRCRLWMDLIGWILDCSIIAVCVMLFHWLRNHAILNDNWKMSTLLSIKGR